MSLISEQNSKYCPACDRALISSRPWKLVSGSPATVAVPHAAPGSEVRDGVYSVVAEAASSERFQRAAFWARVVVVALPAACSPVVEGPVVSVFGSGGVECSDPIGEIVWVLGRDLGRPSFERPSSAPAYAIGKDIEPRPSEACWQIA